MLRPLLRYVLSHDVLQKHYAARRRRAMCGARVLVHTVGSLESLRLVAMLFRWSVTITVACVPRCPCRRDVSSCAVIEASSSP